MPAAQQAAEEAVRRLALRRQDESAWADLEELAGRWQALADAKRLLVEGLARLEQEVEAEASADDSASPFHHELAACRFGRDEALARIDARLSELHRMR